VVLRVVEGERRDPGDDQRDEDRADAPAQAGRDDARQGEGDEDLDETDAVGEQAPAPGSEQAPAQGILHRQPLAGTARPGAAWGLDGYVRER
jgi:hypothetical protein